MSPGDWHPDSAIKSSEEKTLQYRPVAVPEIIGCKDEICPRTGSPRTALRTARSRTCARDHQHHVVASTATTTKGCVPCDIVRMSVSDNAHRSRGVRFGSPRAVAPARDASGWLCQIATASAGHGPNVA